MMLSYVETTKKREMQAFFCDEYDALFEPNSYWSIRASLDMHLRGSGHRAIRFLKLDEVDETKVREVGKAFGRFDALRHAQGKPQVREVTVYEFSES